MTSIEQSTHFPLSERLGRPYLHWALGKLSTEDQVAPSLAPLVVENTLKFLKGAAEHPDDTLTPSLLVDTGWHRLLNANGLYIKHNLREFGTVVWHEPTMENSVNYPPLSPADTFTMLQDWGEKPDEAVWLGDNDDCGGHKCYTCVESLGGYAINIKGDVATLQIPLEPVE